jgi:hypothetical protein
MRSSANSMGASASPAARVTRRNSVVSIDILNDEHVFTKTYFREYIVREEVDAYERVFPLLDGCRAIRLAQIVSWSDENNSITLEYVPAPDLRHVIVEQGTAFLDNHTADLLTLLVNSRKAGQPFDADPANFLLSNESLVIVDPVCRPISIPDYSFVVFIVGVIKAGVRSRSPRIAWEARAFVQRISRRYCSSDCVGTSRTDLHGQVQSYMKQVATWNQDRNETESSAVRMARKAFWGPAAHLFRLSVPWLL